MRSSMKLAPVANPNILLVDDNRDGLLVRKSLLEELGYRVQLAQNGEEGLKLYETSNFDVVVTDLPHAAHEWSGVDRTNSQAES